MISNMKFLKRNNSIKNVDGIIVLVLCIFTDDALYFYQVT